eukprot:gene4537-5134_t
MDPDIDDDIEEERRKINQVNQIADIAGLTKRCGMVQTLYFSANLGDSEFKLLELSNDVLESLKENESVVIRGDESEEAVLCTETETFEVKAADTSNLLTLIPDLKTPKSADFESELDIHKINIVQNLFSYFELKKIRPRLQKLKYLLEKTKYAGPENEEQHLGQTLMLEDLQELVQASNEEIKENLTNIGAFEIKGYWRLLDIAYKEKAFAQILKLLDEESWKYWEIPLHTTCDILEELYPSICSASDWFNVDVESRRSFNHHEFFEAWRQSVPDGMTTKSEQLQGLALEDTDSHPAVIWHFPASNLPEDPQERFNTLFKVRSKWTRQEIEPYIRDLCGPKESMNALLLKFARCSTDAIGNKVYNSKRPIR